MSSNKIIVVKESANSLTVGLPITQETLESVTSRGNTTANGISVGSIVAPTASGTSLNFTNATVSGLNASGITANNVSGTSISTVSATITAVEASSVVASSVTSTNVSSTTNASVSATTNLLTVGTPLISTVLDGQSIEVLSNSGTGNIPSIRFRDTDTSSTLFQPIGQIEFVSNDSGNQGIKALIEAISVNTSGDANLQFYTKSGGGTSGPTERLRINSSGNVSIGASGNATDRLFVSGNSNFDGDMNVVGDIDTAGNITVQKGNPRIRLRDTSMGGASKGFDIQIASSRFEIIDDTHNFDILDFDFDAPSSGHTLTLASNKFVIANAPNGNYNPSASVTVDGSGNVAVGLSGTTHRFHVSGSSAFSGPVVATTVSATSVSSTTANITTVSSTTVNSTNVVATGITASTVSATTISASGITTSGITASVSVTTSGITASGITANSVNSTNISASGLTASGVTANSIGSTSGSINSLVVNRVIPSGTSVLVSGGLIVGPASGAIFNASGHLGINVSPSVPFHVSGSVRLDGQTVPVPGGPGSPADTTTVNAWLSININGTAYKIPLYV
jgi:hypothetical protein